MTRLGILVLALSAVCTGYGDVLTIDPSNYQPAGTLLTTVVPEVTLSDANSSNAIVSAFKITSNQESLTGPLNGLWDYADGGVSFYNINTRLRMDFNVPVTGVQIEFFSHSGSGTTAGTLIVCDSDGNALDTVNSPALADGQSALMSISGLGSNAAYAIAYGENGGFGRLTDLTLTTAPEPGAIGLITFGGLALGLRRDRFRRGVFAC